MLLVGFALGSAEVVAQGHGNGKGKGNAYGHDKNPKKESDHRSSRDNGHQYRDNSHRNNDHYSSRDNHGYSSRDHHGYSNHRYSHGHVYKHRPPHWKHAHGYRNSIRYVYYRDYDVYYDCHRGVYITLSGRNWIYSQHIPSHMHHANFDRIAYVELDYFDDDLGWYLDRRRSGGSVSIHARF